MTERDTELYELPTGWVWTSVGEIYNVIGGGTPSTKVAEYWNGVIPWITSADIHGVNDVIPRKFISRAGIENSATNLVPESSLIVVTRVGLGKIAIAKTQLCFSQDSQALVGYGNNIFPFYSLYYLSKAVQSFIYQSRGTTISGVTKKQLSDVSFPLPPLPEQRRIVAKIEELFTRLDAGVEALKKIQLQLKRYRQSVLKSAFEGRLTNNNVLDGELPDGWKWKQIKEITSVLGDGLHGTPVYSESGEYYFINGNNLSNGKIEIKHNTKRVSVDEYEKYKKPLNENTIFVSINGTLGNTAFYNGEKVILGKSACYFKLPY